MNQIDWAPKAIRQILKLTFPDQNTIRTGVESLREFPACANIKKLVNHRYQYRLRIERYRIFFDFNGIAHIVHIEEVKKRDNNTY